MQPCTTQIAKRGGPTARRRIFQAEHEIPMAIQSRWHKMLGLHGATRVLHLILSAGIPVSLLVHALHSLLSHLALCWVTLGAKGPPIPVNAVHQLPTRVSMPRDKLGSTRRSFSNPARGRSKDGAVKAVCYYNKPSTFRKSLRSHRRSLHLECLPPHPPQMVTSGAYRRHADMQGGAVILPSMRRYLMLAGCRVNQVIKDLGEHLV